MFAEPFARFVGAQTLCAGVVCKGAARITYGGVAELADAGDLKSSAERLAGSNPAAPTIQFTEVPAAGFEPEGRDAQRRGLRPQAEA